MSKLVGIKTYERFRSLWEDNAIDEFSLNFIIDTGLLYTHGIFINGAVFGTAANGAVPLSIAGITNTLALSSHTHSNYLEKNADIDISSYKIKSGDKDLLFYSGGSLYLGNITSPTYISGNNLYSVKGTNVYDILDTSNFSVSNTLPTGYTYNNTAYIKYGSNSHQIDYVKRINTSLSFDYLNTYTLAGTNLLNGIQYGYITLYTDNVYTNPSWAQLRIDIPGKSIQYRTSADASTWINIDLPNIPLNALNVAGIVSAPSSTTTNKVWKTDENGNPAWRDELSYIFSSLKFLLISGTDLMTYNTLAVRTILAGSNISFSHNDGVLTINAQSPTYEVVSKTLAGLAPQLPNETTTTKFLRQDGTWATPTYTSDTNTWREIKVNGTQKRSTNITSGDLNFINGSNTTVEWTSDNKLKINSTWTAWKGATDSANGTAGYMPAPTSAQRGQFLRGDGSWVSLNNYSLPTASNSTLGGVKTGAAITDTTGYTAVAIKDGIIYYKDTNTTYSFSNLLFLQTSGTNLMTYNSQAVRTVLAGSNITFIHSNNVLTIAAKDTTYSTVSKTAAGLCPTLPNETTTTKYLRLDGSWVTPPDNNTWKAANASQEGYVPKSTANKILRANGDGALYWGDDANTTYTFYNLQFQNSGGTTVDTYKPTTSPTKTLKAGSNVTISAASNVITIASTDTNTWRGILDNLTSSSNTTESLSAKQGYLLANGSARDNTKLPIAQVSVELNTDTTWGKTYAESHRLSFVYNTSGREWAYWIGMRSSDAGYGTILRLSHDGLVQYAHKAGGAAGANWSNWKSIITSDNIGSQSVNYASSAGNADTVDSLHFSYSNSSNSPTYLWGTNSNGTSFLAARGSISVNYANSAGNSDTVDSRHATGFVYYEGNPGKNNMNDIARSFYSSTGMTSLASSSVDNGDMSSWTHFFSTSYADGGNGGNAWVFLLACPAGSSNLQFRSRNGGTITNGTAWTVGWTKILHAGNSSVSKSGETLTVKINGTSQSLTNTNTWRGILNNLTSTSTTDSLSAAQGKALNDKFGSYLPLAGGNMTTTAQILCYTKSKGSSDVYNGGILLREATGSTTSCTDNMYDAPGITFHWGGRWVHKLNMHTNALYWDNTKISLDGHTHNYAAASHTHPFSLITDGTCTSTTSGWSHVLSNTYGGSQKSIFYMCNGGGYGAHLRGYSTSASVYMLEIYNSSKQVFAVYGDGHSNFGGNVSISGTTTSSGTITASGGYLVSTLNGNTVTIGSANSGFMHFLNSANIPFWFNKDVKVLGELYAGSSYNQKVWHAGNDGSGSGLDADLLDGYHASSSATANTVALRQANGYLYAVYYNASNGSENIASYTSYVMFKDSNGWQRCTTKAQFQSWLGLGSNAYNSNTYLGAINYNNNSNSTYQVLWGSGNACYGTAGIYVNPYYNYVYATTFYTTSDRSKKQDISEFSEHIRKFQMKDTKTWHYGVIAQEVEEMFRDGEEGNMTVNYSSVLSYYVGCLENSVAGLEDAKRCLENKVKELEEKIKVLETKLNKLI